MELKLLPQKRHSPCGVISTKRMKKKKKRNNQALIINVSCKITVDVIYSDFHTAFHIEKDLLNNLNNVKTINLIESTQFDPDQPGFPGARKHWEWVSRELEGV